MKVSFSIITILLYTSFLCAMEVQSPSSRSDIQIIPALPSSQSEAASVHIVIPEEGSIVEDSKPWIQVRVEDYPLGVRSDLARADKLANSKLGQTAHIVVDNKPYFVMPLTSVDPFNERGIYDQSMYKFRLPFKLNRGAHLLRVFLCRSFGESLKGERLFDTTLFYVKKKKPLVSIDLNTPYLTYNEPSGTLKLKPNMPILLDFYLSNCNLSSDGFKIRLTLDGNIKRYLTRWVPYYIYGLRKGKHSLRLELVDEKNTRVAGDFNDVTRIFILE